ncbi:MAG: OsmC family protein [Cyclobacteriaceae bacterium]
MDDCSVCENPTAILDFSEKEIELISNLDETQKTRLLEIADKCPVNKTLHQSVRTSDTLVSN